MTRLAIIGAGYVGLVTGACLAERGIEVVCVDLDPIRVDDINHGRAPFHEPGLDALLTRTAGHGLAATTDVTEAVRGADVIMLAVGTPSRDGRIDLGQIREAGRLVGELLHTAAAFPVVVVKSTVVPGTTRDVVIPVLEAASGKVAGRDFGVGVNPEFLSEGRAIEDFAKPDRVVVGAEDPRSSDIIASLYAAFPDVPMIRVNTATAEMIKYASNTLLSTLVSFTNEIANLGTAVGGVDTVEVMRGRPRLSLPDQADGDLATDGARSPPTWAPGGVRGELSARRTRRRSSRAASTSASRCTSCRPSSGSTATRSPSSSLSWSAPSARSRGRASPCSD